MTKRRPKQIVRTRYRALSDGSKSIYFDINYKGKRSTETPGLYLTVVKTPEQRQHNKEVELLAENIRAKMQLDIVSGRHGFISEHSKKVNVVDYCQQVFDKKKDNMTPSNYNYGIMR